MNSYRAPNAQWLGSPSYTPNRSGHEMSVQPSYVVIHTMVGSVASANARFQQANQQASAHYGVALDGHLVQWVDERDAAWHAGNYGINLDSIGIEHEDNGDYNGVRTDALYGASAALVRSICQRYNIPIDRAHIRPHKEVSDAPTACPDALDVDRIIHIAAGGVLPLTSQGEDVTGSEKLAWIIIAKAVAGHVVTQADYDAYFPLFKDDASNVQDVVWKIFTEQGGPDWIAKAGQPGPKGEKGDTGLTPPPNAVTAHSHPITANTGDPYK